MNHLKLDRAHCQVCSSWCRSCDPLPREEIHCQQQSCCLEGFDRWICVGSLWHGGCCCNCFFATSVVYWSFKQLWAFVLLESNAHFLLKLSMVFAITYFSIWGSQFVLGNYFFSQLELPLCTQVISLSLEDLHLGSLVVSLSMILYVVVFRLTNFGAFQF